MGLRRIAASTLLLIVLSAVGCAGRDDEAPAVQAEPGQGQQLFANNCAACHGADARGTSQGPPLIHDLYVPSHHSNASFVIAVARGVRSHHWDFGNMPAVTALDIDATYQVICYVRELQLADGLIDEIPTSTPC